ncbi:hypothetical protein L3073_19485 [Ancylomarina sp. DW003]|nr:hypothetical protein [Ancylomarina sp. DW003]MDE5424396.1 hypothetical protein [Ancylomarina sp. DW003]
MEKGKAGKLSDQMEGFQEQVINYQAYEISFRRWLISEIDSERMTMEEARDRFGLHRIEYKRIIRRWQDRYSVKLHLSLASMTTKERTDNKQLEKRINELEAQLELAQMQNIALETIVDIAEQDYKLDIRKKFGPKQ